MKWYENMKNSDIFVDDPTKTWNDLRIILTKKYGEPIGSGNTRLVFKTKKGVLKIDYPVTMGCNETEYDAVYLTGKYIPLPRMRLIFLYGFALLFMEWVEPLKKVNLKNLPDWVGHIDCQQVGYTRDNRLVPYDII